MNTRYFYAVLACLALLVAIPTAIRSQNVVTGQVNGAVVDTTGAAVANARVTLENIATGAEEQPIHTNSTGNFVFPLLKPGDYIVRVSTPNFHTMIAKVEVQLGKIASVKFQLEVGAANGIDVDDIAEVANVRKNKIFLSCGGRSNRFFERHAFDSGIFRAQQLVSTVLDPARHCRVGRAAVGRIVLETAVLRRVVRGRDDDAVGEVILTATVVNQNGSRDDRGRSYTVVLLNDRFDAIGREHFESRALRRPRNGVRILPHVERPVDGLPSPVLAKCLCDGQNVSFIERAVKRRSAVPTGPEAHQLVGVAHVGLVFEVLFFHARNVNQHLPGRRLARERRNRFTSACLRLCF